MKFILGVQLTLPQFETWKLGSCSSSSRIMMTLLQLPWTAEYPYQWYNMMMNKMRVLHWRWCNNTALQALPCLLSTAIIAGTDQISSLASC